MKQILKWLGILLLSFFVLIVFSIVVFQNKIESAALSQLDLITNHQLKYTAANINYMRSFPSITLDLTEPTLYDLDYNEAIQLEQFQVKMNLMKTLFSDPVISRLVVKNGSVTLRERNQKWNIVDLITNDSGQASQTKLITIDELVVENFNVIVDRGSADQILQLTLQSAKMQMSHQNNKLHIEAQGLVQFDYVINDGDSQFVEIFDSFQTTLDYNTQTKHLELSETQFDHGLTAKGWFNASNSERDIQLKVEKLDVSIFNTWLINNQPDAFKLEGELSGIVSMDRVADIGYTFYLDDMGILHDKANLTALNATMTGDQHACTIQNFDCVLDGEELKGSLDYHLGNEKIKSLSLNGDLPLSPLYRLSKDDRFNKIDGLLSIESFVLSDYSVNSKESILNFIECKVNPDKMRLETHDGNSLTVEEGMLSILDDELLLEEVRLKFDKSSLTLNGRYASRAKHFVQLKTSSDFVDINEVTPFFTTNESTTSSNNILENNNVFIELNANAVVWDDLSLKNVTFNINSADNIMHTEVMGDAFGGAIDAAGKLSHNGEHYHLHLNVDAKDIDLKECMKQNRNFGQDVITSQHLRGDMNMLCSFDVFYDKKWTVQDKQTKGVIGATISNGQIKELALMNQFSKFVNIKDLNNIKFTKLNNYLEIQGKNLYIPTMFIQSNAANFTISGYHSTENVQLYYLKVNAGQILTNKFKRHDSNYKPKADKRNGWFNMHYVINGSGEKYTYSRNRSRVTAAFENGLERKDRIYRQLLREFGSVEELDTGNLE